MTHGNSMKIVVLLRTLLETTRTLEELEIVYDFFILVLLRGAGP